MKLRPVALALLAAASGAASAQSFVGITGALDVNVRYIDNTAKQTQLGTDGNTASRLVFYGQEDLGGGYAAGFRIDGAMGPDVGGPATGFNWQRRSTVSLFTPMGEIRLGRDYTPTFWAWTLYDPFFAIGLGNSLNLANENAGLTPVRGAYSTLARANNAVSYFLPSGLGGVFGQFMVAAGEGVVGNRYVGGRLGYASGPFNIAIAASQTQVDPTIDRTADVINLGGSYQLGALRLSGFVNQLKIDEYTRRNYMVGANYKLGQAELKGSYGVVKTTNQLALLPNLNGAGAKQLALGVVYNMSKRTAPYIHYSRIDNDSNSAFRVASGAALARGDNSQAIDIGIRHNF